MRNTDYFRGRLLVLFGDGILDYRKYAGQQVSKIYYIEIN